MLLTRRCFAGLAALAPAALAQPRRIPVGLELFSVREELAKDEAATLRRVAQMGYEIVEFYAPYLEWTLEHAREMRKVLDDSGIRCLSTHNNLAAFTDANLAKTIELNQILGSRYPIVASAGAIRTLDGWKQFAEQMTRVMERLRPAGMATGFHNHQTEWRPIDGQRPMDVIARNTPRDFLLQLDVGTCMEAGADPVAWIRANVGRIKSAHLKDWNSGTEPDRAYRVLFGEGVSPWEAIFEALESAGGVEYYLIEQEGSRFNAFETAERCLANYRRLRGL
jgi:sugar phosphate isomerase/epimerase